MLTYPSVIEGLKDINCSVEQAGQLLKQYEDEIYSLKETITTMGLEVVNDTQADEIILLKATNEELKKEVKELLQRSNANLEYYTSRENEFQRKIQKLKGILDNEII